MAWPSASLWHNSQCRSSQDQKLVRIRGWRVNTKTKQHVLLNGLKKANTVSKFLQRVNKIYISILFMSEIGLNSNSFWLVGLTLAFFLDRKFWNYCEVFFLLPKLLPARCKPQTETVFHFYFEICLSHRVVLENHSALSLSLQRLPGNLNCQPNRKRALLSNSKRLNSYGCGEV